MSLGRHGCHTHLHAEFVPLIQGIHSDLLVDILIYDAVRIVVGDHSGLHVGSQLVRLGLVPTVGIIGLEIEVSTEGLGEGSISPKAVCVLVLGIMLIHERSGSGSVGAVDGGVRFVVAYEVVRAYAIISHHGHSLARHPKSLSQKGKSSGIQVL